MIKRFESLDIATTDLADATETYRLNFGFAASPSEDGRSAVITVGDARIRLRTGDEVAEFVAQSGESMMAVWLEADDVDEVAARLRRAGCEPGIVRVEGERRVLAVDRKLANQVPLFIFDRTGGRRDKP
jgi:hypothetical protein